jgi:hypothetical protein
MNYALWTVLDFEVVRVSLGIGDYYQCSKSHSFKQSSKHQTINIITLYMK